jgi:hypothetical protein
MDMNNVVWDRYNEIVHEDPERFSGSRDSSVAPMFITVLSFTRTPDR